QPVPALRRGSLGSRHDRPFYRDAPPTWSTASPRHADRQVRLCPCPLPITPAVGVVDDDAPLRAAAAGAAASPGTAAPAATAPGTRNRATPGPAMPQAETPQAENPRAGRPHLRTPAAGAAAPVPRRTGHARAPGEVRAPLRGSPVGGCTPRVRPLRAGSSSTVSTTPSPPRTAPHPMVR